MLKVTVVVPIYNVEKYVHKCIESICSQLLTDIEIILVDDAVPHIWMTDECQKP